MPEGVVWGGGEEAGGVGARFLEGGSEEPGTEVGEDGVAGGVEGVGVGWGGVADGGDEEWADDGHGRWCGGARAGVEVGVFEYGLCVVIVPYGRRVDMTVRVDLRPNE